MNTFQKSSSLLLRLSLGWLFLYAGLTKLLDSTWSAAGYLSGAKSLTSFYEWFARPEILPVTNFLNEWGLTLIGIALIFGLFTRLASAFAILLMALYYFPVLEFPLVGHSFLVDEHVIYSLVLLGFIATRAGRVWGLDDYISQSSFFKKNKKFLSRLL